MKSCGKFFSEKPALTVLNIITQSLYILVVLISFFMVKDVDEDNLYSFNVIHIVFLSIILWYQTCAIAYKGCKTMLVIDYLFIVSLIGTEIVELAYRSKGDFDSDKDSTDIKILLGVNRILRVIMVHRRFNDIMLLINKRLLELIDFDMKSPKEIIQILINKLPQEESHIIVILRRVVDLLDSHRYGSRRSHLSHILKSNTSMQSPNQKIVHTYQKDIKLENENDHDREIYDVVPDDEDIEKIFT